MRKFILYVCVFLFNCAVANAQLTVSQLKSFLFNLSNEFDSAELIELRRAISCDDEILFKQYFEKTYQKKADEILQKRLSAMQTNNNVEVNNGILDVKGDLKDFNDFQRIMERLDDTSDSLIDLPKYKNVLKHAELSNKLYWKGERLFFKADFSRAKEVFEFLVLPENRDSFSKGASYFFLGRMVAESGLYKLWSGNEKDIKLNALWQLLQVHKYKTCLTYISYAYADAAELYRQEGFPRHAQALAMIEVPTMDKRPAECARHRIGVQAAMTLRDYTNFFRHLQQWEVNVQGELPQYLNSYKKYVFKRCGSNLWFHCLTNGFNEYHKFEVYSEALRETNNCPFESDFSLAMAHSWLKREAVPENIATNRALNNNVFENNYDKQYLTNIFERGENK